MEISKVCFVICFIFAVGHADSERRLEVLEEKVEKLLSMFEVPTGYRTDSPLSIVNKPRRNLASDELTNSRKLETLQNEVEFLRKEYQRLSADYIRLEDSISNGQHSITLEENTHKTIEWLKTTVTELRSEFVDMAHAANSSALIGQSQEVRTDVEVLKTDIHDVRESLEDLLAGQTKIKNDVTELGGELKRMMEATVLEPTEKIIPLVEVYQSAEEQTHKPRRHRRNSLHNEVDILNHFVKTLVHNQEILERNLHKLLITLKTDSSNFEKIEQELRSVLSRNSKVEELSTRLDGIADKETRLENLLRDATSKLANIDKVQSSTLQLFEAMEGIEDKYDLSLREMQTELTKLDATSQQLAIDIENLKDDEADEKASLRFVESKVQRIQDGVNLLKQHVKETQVTEGPAETKEVLQEQSIVSWIGETQKLYEKLLEALPKSCRDVKKSAVSTILPAGFEKPVTAFCDAETDMGGWMVIQRRTNGEENFNRDWESYKTGFGSPNGEYWLGNDQIHDFTKKNNSELRIDIWDIYGQYWWAQYDSFIVGDVTSDYILHSEGFRGNASDALSYHEGMKFSTLDKDHDISNTNCAQSYQGGWWYSHCQHVNINGKYALGLTWYNSSENEWIAVSRVEMKIREKIS